MGSRNDLNAIKLENLAKVSLLVHDNIIKDLEKVVNRIQLKQCQDFDLFKCIHRLLSHGLRHPSRGYWPLVRELSHPTALRQMTFTEPWWQLGPAWVELTLAEGSLPSYMRSFLQSPTLLRKHYSKFAFLRCPQKHPQILKIMMDLESLVLEDPHCLWNCEDGEDCTKLYASSKNTNRLSKITTDSGLSLESLDSDNETIPEEIDPPFSEQSSQASEDAIKEVTRNLFLNPDEKYYKRFPCHFQYLDLSGPSQVAVLSSQQLYLLDLGPPSLRWALPLHHLSYIRLCPGFQGLSLYPQGSEGPLHLTTGCQDLARSLVSWVEVALRRHPDLSPVSVDCSVDPDWLSGLGLEEPSHFSVVLAQPSICRLRGSLMYSWGHAWKPGTFFLWDSTLYCYEDGSLRFSMALSASMTWKRISGGDRPHMFGRGDGCALRLAAADDLQVTSWIHTMLKAAQTPFSPAQSCWLAVGQSTLLLRQGDCSQPLLRLPLVEISVVSGDKLPASCLCLPIQGQDGGELVWAIFFSTVSEKRLFLESLGQEVQVLKPSQPSLSEHCYQKVLALRDCGLVAHDP